MAKSKPKPKKVRKDVTKKVFKQTKSKKATGLSITREVGKFTFAWKLPSNEYGRDVDYKYSTGWIYSGSGKNKKKSKYKYGEVHDLFANQTEKSVTLSAKKLYPYRYYNKKGKLCYRRKIDHVAFGVRGLTKIEKTEKDLKPVEKVTGKEKIKKGEHKGQYRDIITKTYTKVITTDNHTYSDWAYKAYKISPPNPPTISIERKGAYDSTVTITPSYNNSGVKWATQIQYDVRILFFKKGHKKWPALVWPKESGHRVDIKSSYSFNINHAKYAQSITNAKGSIVWIRARVCGPAGNSKWVTKNFSYAAPLAADNVYGHVVIGRKRLSCTVGFQYKNVKSQPITSIKVQYAFAVPTSKKYVAIDPQWEDAPIGGDGTMKPGAYSNKKRTGKVSFHLDQGIPKDQLLYIRVVTMHNNKESYSIQRYCTENKGGKWKIANLASALEQYKPEPPEPKPPIVLSMPDILDIDIGNTNRVTVTVKNNSPISGVKICFVFIPAEGVQTSDGKTYANQYIKVIQTRTDTEEYTTTMSIPKYYPKETAWVLTKGITNKNFAKNKASLYYKSGGSYVSAKNSSFVSGRKYYKKTPAHFSIGAFSFMGNYKGTTQSTGWTSYSLSKVTHRSSIRRYGGEIPEPPSNMTLKHLGNGNVSVSWTWSYWHCDYAEIAWSDYSDALNSNSAPQKATVLNNHTPGITIRNLELGKKWYFWGRLVKGELESVWTSVKSINLITMPKKPTIVISKDTIALDDTATVSWDFIPTDGSTQDYAELYLGKLVRENNKNVLKYTDVIARVPNADSTDPETNYIVLRPSELGWSAGKSYSLSLAVGGSNGLKSNKSAAKSIRIARAIQNKNLATSMVPTADVYNSSTNPKTYAIDDYALAAYRNDPDHPNRYNLYLRKAIEATPTVEKYQSSRWIMDEDNPCLKLTSLPLTVTVTDADDYPSRLLKIERADDYFIERPDESGYGGYVGEIIYADMNGGVASSSFTEVSSPTVDDIQNYYEYISSTQQYVKTSDTTIVSGKNYYILTNITRTYTINKEDLSGSLDDDARYYLTYKIEDDYGQSTEKRTEFVVKWDHQAIMPSADIVIEEVKDTSTEPTTFNDSDDDYDERIEVVVPPEYDSKFIAKITINTPTSGTVVAGDSCDIYRISANSIDLIYEGAEFGHTYVDPYPTIGDHGGHRIVFKTIYGDYITENGSLAWLDFRSENTNDAFYSDSHIIDFDDESVKIKFNVNIDNSWSKDFQETKYLGGSIQGDWNEGVSMSSSVSANVLTKDWDTVTKLRRLAKHAGICHVRTRDGMNYLANIMVSESTPYNIYYDPERDTTQLAQYSLDITMVDPVELDGMSLEEWERTMANNVIILRKGVSDDDDYDPYEDDDIDPYVEPDDPDEVEAESIVIEDEDVEVDEPEYDTVDGDYEESEEDSDEEDEYSDEDYEFEPEEDADDVDEEDEITHDFEEVAEPTVDDIDYYYEYDPVNEQYIPTDDTEIDDEKTYYMEEQVYVVDDEGEEEEEVEEP